MAVVNASNASKREQFMFFNTLAGVVKNLEFKYTTVDLRNECAVTGRIVAVDGGMNIEMDNVLFYDYRGNKKSFDTFYIKSRNIRNVHIPKKYDAVELLQDQLASMKKVRKKPNMRRTLKVSRATKYNASTTRENYGTTSGRSSSK